MQGTWMNPDKAADHFNNCFSLLEWVAAAFLPQSTENVPEVPCESQNVSRACVCVSAAKLEAIYMLFFFFLQRKESLFHPNRLRCAFQTAAVGICTEIYPLVFSYWSNFLSVCSSEIPLLQHNRPMKRTNSSCAPFPFFFFFLTLSRTRSRFHLQWISYSISMFKQERTRESSQGWLVGAHLSDTHTDGQISFHTPTWFLNAILEFAVE